MGCWFAANMLEVCQYCTMSPKGLGEQVKYAVRLSVNLSCPIFRFSDGIREIFMKLEVFNHT